jgi:superfamily I DNA/RNA helicase
VLGTIHASKGSEIDVVVIDGNISKRIMKRIMSDEGRDEEIRVWFTGVTRARSGVYLFNFENNPLLRR